MCHMKHSCKAILAYLSTTAKASMQGPVKSPLIAFIGSYCSYLF